MFKIISAIVAAAGLLAFLRFSGATPDLDSPLLLAEMCGLLALGALTVALMSSEEEDKDGELSHPPMTTRVTARAARRPQWPSM